MKRLALGFAVFSIAACSQNQPGQLPSGKLKETIEAEVKRQLSDPASVQIEWYAISPMLDRYCLRVNARNSFGGYVGFQPLMVLFKDNTKSAIALADLPTSPNDAAAEEANCIHAGYPVDSPPAD